MSYKPTVATIGTSGFLSQPVIDGFHVEYLSDKVQFFVRAVTRNISLKPSGDDKVSYVEGTLDEGHKQNAAEELLGVDTVISLLPVDPEAYKAIEWILKEIKPKVYFPLQFNTNAVNSEKVLPGFLAVKTNHSNAVRSAGIKVVDTITSFFAHPGSFLYEHVAHIVIGTKAKAVTYHDSPGTKVAVSTLPDFGNTVAALTSIAPSELPDTVRIQSDEVSFKEIAARYETDHDVKLAVKNIAAEEALEAFKKAFEKKAPNTFTFGLLAIAAQGRDKGTSYSKNDNELVNPDHKYWTWAKY